jgi:hypothetical protein
MRARQNKDNSFVHLISDEKLAEFKGMSLRARLHWLEVANVFVNKAIGTRRRALFDSRFETLISKK